MYVNAIYGKFDLQLFVEFLKFIQIKMGGRKLFQRFDKNHPCYEDTMHLCFSIVKSFDKTNKENTFEEFVNYIIEQYSNSYEGCCGNSKVQDNYNAIVEIWKINGRDVSKAYILYYTRFSDLFDEHWLTQEQIDNRYKEGIKFIDEQIRLDEVDLVQRKLTNEKFDYLKHIKIEKVIKELHDIIHEVPKSISQPNIEVTKLSMDKKNEKESSDSFTYIWGAVALFFILLPFAIKYPYLITIVVVMGVIYQIKRQN